jgi:5-methylcytosine-specific restriction enzyme A
LDPDNLVTLCESPAHNCHLIFGHLLSWQSWNVDVFADAASFRAKVSARPGANKP